MTSSASKQNFGRKGVPSPSRTISPGWPGKLRVASGQIESSGLASSMPPVTSMPWAS